MHIIPLLTEQLDTGVIVRNLLLQPGQVIQDLNHGIHTVTEGAVHIGFLGEGTVTKVIGIMVDNSPTTTESWQYNPINQPFNRNFACVLYELKQAGHNNCSYSSLDYATVGRDISQPNTHLGYLQSYRQSIGKPGAHFGEISITNKVINGLAN